MHTHTDRQPFMSMEDEPTQRDSQAWPCCHEVSECDVCESLSPGREELDLWDKAESDGSDEHIQLEDGEESPASSDHQELSRDSEEQYSSGGQMDGHLDFVEELLPQQENLDHPAAWQGTTNYAHTPRTPVQRHNHRQVSEPCWYCMKSLTTDTMEKLQLDFETLGLPPRGKRYSFLQDPRPHFGVARSSRSTPLPLWGCEGPFRRERRGEDGEQTSTCPHCHLALPLDTLRWHEGNRPGEMGGEESHEHTRVDTATI